jgi:hypothetical protein
MGAEHRRVPARGAGVEAREEGFTRESLPTRARRIALD